MSRPKRSYELLPGEPILSASEVEKKLVSEMGNNVCIFERVCSSYAQKAAQRKSRHSEMDWTDILRYELLFNANRTSSIKTHFISKT